MATGSDAVCVLQLPVLFPGVGMSRVGRNETSVGQVY